MAFRLISFAVLVVLAASCSSAVEESADAATSSPSSAVDAESVPETTTSAVDAVPEDFDPVPEDGVVDFGPAPEVPVGDFTPEIAAAIDTVFGLGSFAETRTNEQNQALVELGQSGDVRVAWILLDLLRFPEDRAGAQLLTEGVNTLTDSSAPVSRAWTEASNKMIAWDIPAPPGYGEIKRQIYSNELAEWGPLFDQSEGMDWRFVSWGGVSIDDRPYDQTDESCNCIPAADNPPTQTSAETTWLQDADIVFGVVINGEARAYPRQIMEVREMVNDTLGGRRIAIPYCTLCGSAQAYYTDELGDEFEQPVFRTSGLLIRSNKMMYELNTKSFVDTFIGRATSGPLAEAGVSFNQASVVTSTWGEWKAAHPDTTIVAEDGGLGRSYELDPLGGRDDNGPIFPIGAVDLRLPVQEPILGVRTLQGDPIAFHVATAREILEAGDRVVAEDIELLLDGDGIRAVRADGSDAAGHQSFWFAWSQFWPRTQLWPHDYQADS